MKGGKGGLGRKKPPSKGAEPAGPGRSAARGTPKRDWGPISSDSDDRLPANPKPRGPKDKS